MGYNQNILKAIKTKFGIIASAVVLGLGGMAFVFPLMAHASTCAPTGFFRDGTNMTAAVINPTSPVTGEVDATGCNVGVYFGPGTSGSVNAANIHGASYYGVVVQKAKVNVENSNIHQIGDAPLDGSQHGAGIYYATVAGLANGDCSTGSTKGTVENNSISAYQKGGIVIACTGTDVSVDKNTVEGQGPVNYIAQNGIQFGYGADGEIESNIVTGNSYTGAGQAASGGILVVGGQCYGGDYTTGVDISKNVLVQNDVGVYLSNLDASCAPASTKTKIDVENNTIANASLNNTTGNSATQGYQAGVSDQGDKDKISSNTISGAGYNPANSGPSISTNWIDVSATNHAKVHANKLR